MAKKDKTATELLNLALAGLESNLAVLGGMAPEDGPLPVLIDQAREHAEDIRNHLLTIQFHLAQLR